MGTWGAAIFSDDVACDVRDAYLAKLADGETPARASRAIIAEYGELDDDEGPIFWFALAATQWEYGALDATVKRRALKLLDAGRDSAAWKEAGTDKRRAAALAALAKKLRTPPPKPKRPRRRAAVEVPSRDVPSPDGSAIATAFTIGNLAQVMIEIPSLGGGGGVFAAECALDDVEVRWRGNKKLEITHPPKARVHPPVGDPKKFFLSGRTIAISIQARR